jgi:hypothetical protein
MAHLIPSVRNRVRLVVPAGRCVVEVVPNTAGSVICCSWATAS